MIASTRTPLFLVMERRKLSLGRSIAKPGTWHSAWLLNEHMNENPTACLIALRAPLRMHTVSPT